MLRTVDQLKTVAQQNRIEAKLQNRNALKEKKWFAFPSRGGSKGVRGWPPSEISGPPVPPSQKISSR